MRRRNEIFYAKIMLFGEYCVICDSMGLSIPYARFKGELSFLDGDQYTDLEFGFDSNIKLTDYFEYLKKLQKDKKLLVDLNLAAMKKDVDNGLYFESNIPQGFGIGSSGALCAAIYARYCLNKIPGSRHVSKENILILRKLFAQMESYFHGVSSGIDPLNCYLKYPILIKSKSELHTVGIPRNKHNRKGAIFLVNTGNPGKTEPLVNLFLEKCKEQSFYKKIKNEMIPFNDNCIKSLINGESRAFFQNLKSLSAFLLENMSPMIPHNFKKIWAMGLETNSFYLKLCGSGGGGFLLGFTENFTETRLELQKHNIALIPVYKSSK